MAPPIHGRLKPSINLTHNKRWPSKRVAVKLEFHCVPLFTLNAYICDDVNTASMMTSMINVYDDVTRRNADVDVVLNANVTSERTVTRCVIIVNNEAIYTKQSERFKLQHNEINSESVTA